MRFKRALMVLSFATVLLTLISSSSSSAVAAEEMIDAGFMLEPGVHIEIIIATRDSNGKLLVRDKYAHPGSNWPGWQMLEKVPLAEFMRRRHPEAKTLKVLWKPNHGEDWLGEVFIIYQVPQ